MESGYTKFSGIFLPFSGAAFGQDEATGCGKFNRAVEPGLGFSWRVLVKNDHLTNL